MTKPSFFQDILPSKWDGCVVVGEGPQGPSRQSLVYSLRDLLMVVARGAQTPGRDFYFTPATYTLGAEAAADNNWKGTRTSAACTFKRCFAIDIDLNHPKKPSYTTKQEAAAALLRLVKALSMPMFSYIVDSGRGLHVYWALDQDVPAARWQAMADALKPTLIAQDPKLFCDATRVSDLAGYLRLPLSHNTKSGTQVKIAVSTGTIARLADLEALAFKPASAAAPVFGGLPGAPAAQARPGRVADLGYRNDATVPDPMALLSKQCVPLAVMAVKPDTQSYEAWFAVARLMARADEPGQGLAAFHAFSRRHPGYKPADTEKKFKDALGGTRASPSCQQMREWAGLPTSACANCPLFRAQGAGGKPAALQVEFIEPEKRKRAEAEKRSAAVPAADPELAAGLEEEAARMAAQRAAIYTRTEIPLATLGMSVPRYVKTEGDLPQGKAGTWYFVRDDDGAFVQRVVTERKDPELGVVLDHEDTKIANYAVWPVVGIIDPETGGQRPRLMFAKLYTNSFGSGEPVWKGRIYTPPEDDTFFSPTRLKTALAAEQIGTAALNPVSKAWLGFFTWLQARYEQTDLSRASTPVDKAGWRFDQHTGDHQFVIGDRAYGKGWTATLIPRASMSKEEKADTGMNQKGSVKISALVFKAMMEQALTDSGRAAALLALASPLMHMTPAKGLLAYIYGATGTGKTLLLDYCRTFYNSPQDASMIKGSDTVSSVFHNIGRQHHLPALVDEVTAMTPEDQKTLMLMISAGAERNRMFSDRNELRKASSWCNTTLVSTNTPPTDGRMIDVTAEGQARLMRVMVFDTAGAKGHPLYTNVGLGSKLVTVATNNFGFIGRVFAGHVLNHYEAVKTRVDHWLAWLAEHGGLMASRATDGQVSDEYRFWRAGVAVILTTAELVSAGFGATPGLNLMAIPSFLDTLIERMTGAVVEQDELVTRAMAGVSTGMEAVRATNARLAQIIENAARMGNLSIYSVADPSGALVHGAVMERMSKTGLVHAPKNMEGVRLHITLGSKQVLVGVSSQAADDYMALLRTRGVRSEWPVMHDIISRSNPAVPVGPGSGQATLPGRSDTVVTVTTAALPSSGVTWYLAELRSPATEDLKLDWA